MSRRAQGSLEYLLLIGGAILVGVVVFLLAQSVVGEGKGILSTNLETSIDISQTSTDNVFTPLAEITMFTAEGGDGKILLTYTAPGANSFLLVVEIDEYGSGVEIIDTLNEPSSFDDAIDGVQKFSLPFYESSQEYGAATNDWTYHFRLRACDAQGTCLVSPVQTAVAGLN
jgi:hypothetical protein